MYLVGVEGHHTGDGHQGAVVANGAAGGDGEHCLAAGVKNGRTRKGAGAAKGSGGDGRGAVVGALAVEDERAVAGLGEAEAATADRAAYGERIGPNGDLRGGGQRHRGGAEAQAIRSGEGDIAAEAVAAGADAQRHGAAAGVVQGSAIDREGLGAAGKAAKRVIRGRVGEIQRAVGKRKPGAKRRSRGRLIHIEIYHQPHTVLGDFPVAARP